MPVDRIPNRKEKVVDTKITGFVDAASLDNAGKLRYTEYERIHSGNITSYYIGECMEKVPAKSQ